MDKEVSHRLLSPTKRHFKKKKRKRRYSTNQEMVPLPKVPVWRRAKAMGISLIFLICLKPFLEANDVKTICK